MTFDEPVHVMRSCSNLLYTPSSSSDGGGWVSQPYFERALCRRPTRSPTASCAMPSPSITSTSLTVSAHGPCCAVTPSSTHCRVRCRAHHRSRRSLHSTMSTLSRSTCSYSTASTAPCSPHQRSQMRFTLFYDRERAPVTHGANIPKRLSLPSVAIGGHLRPKQQRIHATPFCMLARPQAVAAPGQKVWGQGAI